MAKYSSDKYLVTLFDSVGTRLRSEDVTSYTSAKQLGDLMKESGQCDSYAIMRVLYNSKEPHQERYDVKSSS